MEPALWRAGLGRLLVERAKDYGRDHSAWVHLTWTPETDPRWPSATLVDSWDALKLQEMSCCQIGASRWSVLEGLLVPSLYALWMRPAAMVVTASAMG